MLRAEAISAKFASDQEGEEIRLAIGDQRRLDIRNVLENSGLALLALDDVWNGSALFAILSASPETLPVLVTSRAKFATSRGRLDRAFEVGDLSPPDALRLLVGHAGEELCQPVDEAEALCRDLGYPHLRGGDRRLRNEQRWPPAPCTSPPTPSPPT